MRDAKHTIGDINHQVAGPFKVMTVDVAIETADGVRNTQFINFERGVSVAVVLHDPDRDELLFTRQWRCPAALSKDPRVAGGYLLELPAGMVKPGESPRAAAKREVEEELGYSTSRLEFITYPFMSPGGSTERIAIFYAQVGARVGAGGGVKDEHEHIELVRIPRINLANMIETGGMHDAKTLIGVMWLNAMWEHIQVWK